MRGDVVDRIRTTVKEIYQQVDEYEYNRINPYKEMLESIRREYPRAEVTSTKTETLNIGSIQVPTLTIKYITG